MTRSRIALSPPYHRAPRSGQAPPARAGMAGMAAVAAALLAATVAAACGSTPAASSTSPAAGPTSTTGPGPAATPASPSSPAAYTVGTATVGGLGSVLVDGGGRTLYLLSSEAGGKLTCTDASGCTNVWPDTELPDGVTHGVAGAGVSASSLGTVTSPDGKLYLVYGPSKWPLYTFSGDSAPGQANGQGIHSFGGTWSAVSPGGDAVAGATRGGGY